jgi:hypothetical protein
LFDCGGTRIAETDFGIKTGVLPYPFVGAEGNEAADGTEDLVGYLGGGEGTKFVVLGTWYMVRS